MIIATCLFFLVSICFTYCVAVIIVKNAKC